MDTHLLRVLCCTLLVCRYSSIGSIDPPVTAAITGDIKMPSSKVSMILMRGKGMCTLKFKDSLQHYPFNH